MAKTLDNRAEGLMISWTKPHLLINYSFGSVIKPQDWLGQQALGLTIKPLTFASGPWLGHQLIG